MDGETWVAKRQLCKDFEKLPWLGKNFEFYKEIRFMASGTCAKRTRIQKA